jgi:hypothetical protein
MTMPVQRVFVTASVAAKRNAQRALLVRAVADAPVPDVQGLERIVAVRRWHKRHAVMVHLTAVPVRTRVQTLAQAQSEVGQVQPALQVTAAARVPPHVRARVSARDRPVPIAHVAPPFFPSNLTDNRLARPACKICHHEYLN